jgi:hypothetical protein
MTAEAVATPGIPGPSYKRYRGNSRRKRGPFATLKRWGARRRTKRKLKMAHRANPNYTRKSRKGTVTVDKPIRNK